MKKLGLIISCTLLLVVFVFYLSLPNYNFPQPPPGSVQSMEGADTETLLRRGYFTNYTREEVLTHYQKQFDNIPTLRLNYPPEEAQTLIRDQTHSVFLQEFVHPLRESLFINGFKFKNNENEVWYKGVRYEQKIIIKFIPTSYLSRILVGGLISLSIVLIYKELLKLFNYD